jgi:hypothetical protein
MISLSDAELDVVCRMGCDLPLEKRGVYLERIAAILRQLVQKNLGGRPF